MRILGFIFSLFVVAYSVPGGALHGFSAKGIRIPIFDGTNRVMVIRVARLYEGQQRKGFFRIGPLRMAMAEDLVVEVEEPSRLANELSQVHTRLTELTTSVSLEIRRFSIRDGRSGLVVLEAELARADPCGLELKHRVDLRTASRVELHPWARLIIAGDHPGQLFDRTGRPIASLPDLLETASPSKKLKY